MYWTRCVENGGQCCGTKYAGPDASRAVSHFEISDRDASIIGPPAYPALVIPREGYGDESRRAQPSGGLKSALRCREPRGSGEQVRDHLRTHEWDRLLPMRVRAERREEVRWQPSIERFETVSGGRFDR